MGACSGVQSLVIVVAASFVIAAFVMAIVVNQQVGSQQQIIQELYQSQSYISTETIIIQEEVIELNQALGIINASDVEAFYNDTQLVAEMYLISERLNTTALMSLNGIPGVPTITLTGNASIVILPLTHSVQVTCLVDTQPIQNQLIVIQGEIVGIDSQVSLLNSIVAKQIRTFPSNDVVSANFIKAEGDCGIQVITDVETKTITIDGCGIANYSSSVEQDIINVTNVTSQLYTTMNNINNTLTNIETVVTILNETANLDAIIDLNGLNGSVAILPGNDKIQVTNVPSQSTIQFGVSGIKSINGQTGPNVNIVAGANMVVTTTPPSSIQISTTAEGYSTCYQQVLSGSPIITTNVYNFVQTFNQWSPILFPGYGFVCFSGFPFTDTNCPEIYNNFCFSGWSFVSFPGNNGFLTYVVPPSGRLWKLSLYIVMSLFQQSTDHFNNYFTPTFAMSADQTCQTNVNILFSMSMFAFDNSGNPGANSFFYYGEITAYSALPEWTPGTRYYLCVYNIGEGYPSSSSTYMFFPMVTKIF